MDRRESTSSQETSISLQQLDPSPIDTPPDIEKQLPELPAPSPPPKSSTVGLSGGGHSSVYYLTRLQKYSSYAFTVFTSIHLANTSIIPLLTRSVPASEPYLLLTRPFYQTFPLEPLLITLPIATHVLSGLALRIHRRNANLTRYGASNLSIYGRLKRHLKVWPVISWTSLSGLVLLPLVTGHALINRLLPFIYEGGSSGVGLGFVSHGFAIHPVVSRVGYMALVSIAAGHFVWGAAKWNGWLPRGSGKKARTRWWLINGFSVAFAWLWMAGGFGVVGRGGRAEGWVGNGYDAMYELIM